MDGSINFSGTLAGSIADSGGRIQDVQTNANGDYTSVVDEQEIAKIDLFNYATNEELESELNNYTTNEELESAVNNINSVLLTKQNVVNYSTEEQNTGRKWIDGKQLYERTINCGELTFGTHNIETLTVEEVKFIKGFVEDINDSSYIRPLPFAADSSNSIRVDISNNILRIITYASWSGYRAYLTIQYTKNSE